MNGGVIEQSGQPGAECVRKDVEVIATRKTPRRHTQVGKGLFAQLLLEQGEIAGHRFRIRFSNTQEKIRLQVRVASVTFGGDAENAAIVPPDRRRTGEVMREERGLLP